LIHNELAKIHKDEGRKDLAKKHFELALENCSFKKVKQDAKAEGFYCTSPDDFKAITEALKQCQELCK
jgi:hypothetical protein